MPDPVAQAVQGHQPNRDADDPIVQQREKPRPARLDARSRLMDRDTGKLSGDERMALTARGLQVIWMNG